MGINENFVLKEVEDHYYLLDTSDTEAVLLQINETGAFLWERLAAGADKEGLVKSLLEEYSVEEAVVRPDVEEFLARLSRIGAIK